MTNSSPQLYVGQSASDWLIEHFNQDDTSMSSLWREQASQFNFDGKKFEGLTGFGNHEEPVQGIRRLAHSILLKRYSRFGRRYSRFKEIDRHARDIAARQNRLYNLDILRQSLSLSFLYKFAEKQMKDRAGTIVIIGDGFGTLASLILSTFPEAKVVLINLTKVLLVDIVYLKKALPGATIAAVGDQRGLEAGLQDSKINALALRSDNSDLLRHLPISLATNMVSMQEMNPPVIADYFASLRSSVGAAPMFYCCNREEKTLTDGTVVRFDEYPWRDDDDVLIDELCPWNQDFYTLRPPFYYPYDGPIRHRLTTLVKN